MNDRNDKYLNWLLKICTGIIVVMLPVCIYGGVYIYKQKQLDKEQRARWAAIMAESEELERQKAEIKNLGGNPDDDFKYIPSKKEEVKTENTEDVLGNENTEAQDKTEVKPEQPKDNTAEQTSKPFEPVNPKPDGPILPNTRSQIEMANNPVVGDIVYGSSGSPSRWDGKNWVYAGEPLGEREVGNVLTGEFTSGSNEEDKYITWQ